MAKRKGGSMSWQMTMFHPAADALKDFREDIWRFWENPSGEKMEQCLRIKFSIEWEKPENALAINEQVIEREAKKHPHSKRMVNPLLLSSDSPQAVENIMCTGTRAGEKGE